MQVGVDSAVIEKKGFSASEYPHLFAHPIHHETRHALRPGRRLDTIAPLDVMLSGPRPATAKPPLASPDTGDSDFCTIHTIFCVFSSFANRLDLYGNFKVRSPSARSLLTIFVTLAAVFRPKRCRWEESVPGVPPDLRIWQPVDPAVKDA
jgi:hypothetical protein